MELLTIKIIALTLLGVFSLFFGLLPLRLRKVLTKGTTRRRERIVSCLLCFGGGVLFATVFTHMLPETREGFEAAALGVSYPLAEVVICAGFFLIYFMEEFVHKIFFKRDTRQKEKLTKLAAAIDGEEENYATNTTASNKNTTSNGSGSGSGSSNDSNNSSNNDSNTINIDEQSDSSASSPSSSPNPRCSVYSVNGSAISPKCLWGTEGVANPVFAGDIDATGWNPALRQSIVMSSSMQNLSEASYTNKINPGIETSNPSCSQAPPPPSQQYNNNNKGMDMQLGSGHGHTHSHGHTHLAMNRLGSKNMAANLRSLLVIVALSFHSVFEGLAVGLQEREVDVWYLLGAISAHKFVIAFCMGLELLAGGTPAGLMVIYMVVFALVSPLGVALGILVTENLATGTSGHLLTVTILQGLAGGTILYVTFFEVLERERGRAGGRLVKFLFILMGFGAMASLEAIGGHSHGHSKHGHSHGHSHEHTPLRLPIPTINTTATTTATTTVAAITGGGGFHDHHHDHDHHHQHDHGHHDHDH